MWSPHQTGSHLQSQSRSRLPRGRLGSGQAQPSLQPHYHQARQHRAQCQPRPPLALAGRQPRGPHAAQGAAADAGFQSHQGRPQLQAAWVAQGQHQPHQTAALAAQGPQAAECPRQVALQVPGLEQLAAQSPARSVQAHLRSGVGQAPLDWPHQVAAWSRRP